jgi:MYXO-CTERM domain-containing protein
MVAVGTGATTGITLWVVADGRWEPQNFPFFTLTDPEIVWDWTTSSSNYETLRLAQEASLGGKGWQVESSLELNQSSISSTVTQNVDIGVNGGPATTGAYLPTESDGGIATGDGGGEDAGGSGGADGGEGQSSEEFAAATQDLGILFNGISGPNARITRMRTDIAHAALGTDLILQASADQGELTNVYSPGKQIGQPQCPVFDNQCEVTGQVPRDQAVAASNGGCNATRSTSGSPMALLGLAGFLGLGAIRSRRRRG